MQADKLSKGAPGHPTHAHESQPVKTGIPHDDVSRKQSEMQKQNPVPTQIKQGNTVTLTQVSSKISAWPPRMPAFVHDHPQCTAAAERAAMRVIEYEVQCIRGAGSCFAAQLGVRNLDCPKRQLADLCFAWRGNAG